MFGFGKKEVKKEEPKTVLEVTVYRTGEDYQYVTMHINDWYKVMKELKTPIRNQWRVRNGKK